MQPQDDAEVPEAPSPDLSNQNSVPLPGAVRREFERNWSLEYADFVVAHNATIEAEGLPLDGWKAF